MPTHYHSADDLGLILDAEDENDVALAEPPEDNPLGLNLAEDPPTAAALDNDLGLNLDDAPVAAAAYDNPLGLNLDDTPEEQPDPDTGYLGVLGRGIASSYHQTALSTGLDRVMDDLRRRNEITDEFGKDMPIETMREYNELNDRIGRNMAGLREHDEGLMANPPTEETARLLRQEGIEGVFDAIGKGFFKVAGELSARSAMPTLISGGAALAGGIVGGFAGPPGAIAGAMGATALASGTTEYNNSILTEMRSAGVDIHNRKELETFLEDDDAVAAMTAKALIRAGIVGGFDGIATGLAFLKLVPKGIKSKVTRNLVNAFVSQPIAQGTAGGAGEAFAQLATERKIHMGEVAAEILGELGTAPIDMAAAGISAARAKGNIEYDPDLGRFVPLGGAAADMNAANEANIAMAEELMDGIENAEDAQVEQPTPEPETPIDPAEVRDAVAEEVINEGGDALDAAVAGTAASRIADDAQPPTTLAEDPRMIDALADYQRFEAEETLRRQAMREDAEATAAARKEKEQVALPMVEPEPEPTAEAEPTPMPEPEPAQAPEPTPMPEPEPTPAPEPTTPAPEMPTGERGEDVPFSLVTEPVTATVAGQEVVVDTEPTEAKIKSGNYRKGHIKLAGLDISLENLPGTERRGTAPDGTEWSVTMPSAYGYVRGTEGADGDQVDVYVGESPESQNVYVVDQIDPATGEFDEHKALLAFDNIDEATATYDAGFSDQSGPSRRGAISEMSVDEFKAWLKTDTKGPVAGVAGRVAPRVVEEDDTHFAVETPGDRMTFEVEGALSYQTSELTTASPAEAGEAIVAGINRGIERGARDWRSLPTVSTAEVQAYERLAAQGHDVVLNPSARWSARGLSTGISNKAVFTVRMGAQAAPIDARAPARKPRLRATHNLGVEFLESAVKEGGLIAPSIAIQEEQKANLFGRSAEEARGATVVFKPSALRWGDDPVFPDDAHTPEFPSVTTAVRFENFDEGQAAGERVASGVLGALDKAGVFGDDMPALADEVRDDLRRVLARDTSIGTALPGGGIARLIGTSPTDTGRRVVNRLKSLVLTASFDDESTALLDYGMRVVRELKKIDNNTEVLKSVGSALSGLEAEATVDVLGEQRPATPDNIILNMGVQAGVLHKVKTYDETDDGDLVEAYETQLVAADSPYEAEMEAENLALQGRPAPTTRELINAVGRLLPAVSPGDNRFDRFDMERGLDLVNMRVRDVETARELAMRPTNRPRERLLEAKPMRPIGLDDVQRVVVNDRNVLSADTIEALTSAGVEVVELNADLANQPSLRELQSPEEALFSLPDNHVMVVKTDRDAIMLVLENDQGAEIGRVTARVDRDRGVVRMTSSILRYSERGQGAGLAMYNRVLAEAADLGYALESDDMVSDSAVRVYEAMRRRGLNVVQNPKAHREGTETFVPYGESVFRVEAPRAIKLKVADLPSQDLPADHHALIKESVERAIADLKVGPKVKVVRTAKNLPKGLAAMVERHGAKGAEGVFMPTENTVYIVSDFVPTPQRAEQLVLHEAVAHGGLRHVFGKNLDPLLDDVYKSGDQAAIGKLAEKYQAYADFETNANSRRRLTEEYVASVAEGMNERGTWFDRFVAALQRLLARMGIGGWSRNNIVDMLKRVRTTLETPHPGMATDADTGEPVASLSPKARNAEDTIVRNTATDTLDAPITENRSVEAIAQALNDRSLRMLKGRGRNRRVAARIIAREVDAALTRDPTLGARGEKMRAGARALENIHPELKTNAEARMAMNLAIALTGADMTTADAAYARYRANDRFPVMGGAAGEAGAAFRRANNLLALVGGESLGNFLETEYSVAELKDFGVNIMGERASTRLPGSAVFGPEAMQAYGALANKPDAIAIDTWLMRSWGRITGSLIRDGRTAERPRNGTERAAIRRAVNDAVRILRRDHPDMNPQRLAEVLQAHERRLYETLSERRPGEADVSPFDDAVAVARRRAGRGQGVDGRTLVGGIPSTADGYFKVPRPGEAQQDYAVRHVRATTQRGYQTGRALGSLPSVRGVRAIRTFAPTPEINSAFATVGMAAPQTLELPASPEAADLFASLAGDAAVSNTLLYQTMRLFVSADGLSGVALDGPLVNSLFDRRGDSRRAMIALAVDEGGSQVATDDMGVYAAAGFRPVAPGRMALDRTYMGELEAVPSAPRGRDLGDLTAERSGEWGLAALESDVAPMFAFTDAEIRTAKTGPVARLRKLVGVYEAESARGRFPAMDRVGEFISSNRRAAVLAAIPRRAFVDYLPDNLAPSLRKYLRIAARQSAARNAMQERYGALVKGWVSWARKNADESATLANLMHTSTIAGIDPSKPSADQQTQAINAGLPWTDMQKDNYERLAKAYNLMSEDAQHWFNQVRDSYAEMRSNMEAALLVRVAIEQSKEKGRKSAAALIAEMRVMFEKARVRGPYFPLTRYGSLWASAKDEEGNVLAFAKFETNAERKRWVAKMKELGHATDQGSQLDKASDLAGQVNPKFVKDVSEMVGSETLRDEIYQMYLRSLPELSVRRHFIHRKNRLGFSADAIRNYANFSARSAAQEARVQNGHLLNRALEDLQVEVAAIENQPDKYKRHEPWAGPLYQELLKRHKASMEQNVAPLSTFLTSVGFDLFLAGSPAAAMVNLTQVPLVALPLLSARFGTTRAMTELVRAIGDMTFGSQLHKGMDGVYNHLRDKGESVLASDLLTAYKAGEFGQTQAHELAGMGTATASASRSRFVQAHEATAFLFHSAEVVNRMVTYVAAYRLAERAGGDTLSSIVASEETFRSQFDYSQENRPAWMQNNVVRVMFLFKVYAQNIIYRLYRSFHDSIAHETPARRTEARKEFAGMILMGWLFSGMQGLPFLSSVVPWIVETMFSDEDDPLDAEYQLQVELTKLFGETTAKAIMFGAIDAFTPASVSDRLSYGNLVWRDAYPLADEEKAALQWWVSWLGPLPAFAMNFVTRGLSSIAEGDVQKGVEYMMPKWLADLSRAQRIATEGEVTSHKPSRIVVPPEDISVADIIAQGIGYKPARIAWQKRENLALQTAVQARKDRRELIMDQIAMAYLAKDSDAIKDVAESINSWNAKNPAWPLTVSGIVQSLKGRLVDRAESVHGVQVPRNLLHLRKQLQTHMVEKE